MKKYSILALLVVAFSLTSCSSLTRGMREPIVHFELNSDDYVLSEPVSGTATSVYVLGIDWKRLFHTESAYINTPIVSSPVSSFMGLVPSTQTYAIYDMMENNPGYDFVMYPQYKSEVRHFLWFIYAKEKTTVTARLGRLNDEPPHPQGRREPMEMPKR